MEVIQAIRFNINESKFSRNPVTLTFWSSGRISGPLYRWTLVSPRFINTNILNILFPISTKSNSNQQPRKSLQGE